MTTKNTENEKKALQNWANNFSLTVKEHFTQDQRKKQRYLLVKNSTTISNAFTYNEMNIFLLGLTRAKNFQL